MLLLNSQIRRKQRQPATTSAQDIGVEAWSDI
jgi:hypothetical protein